jgi:hypothetical protein
MPKAWKSCVQFYSKKILLAKYKLKSKALGNNNKMSSDSQALTIERFKTMEIEFDIMKAFLMTMT